MSKGRKSPSERLARQLSEKVHGNDSLWEFYLDDARRELDKPRSGSESATVMPFGQHKGKKLCDLPGGYLMWLLANVDLRESLRTAIELEMEDRLVWRTSGE